jgi:two-component system, NtrC family, nitrogen regulation response regulator NtrX
MELINELSILIVEDDEFSALALKRIMENYWAQVDIVLNWYDALAKVQNKDYNYIFVDVWLPWMDWIETTKLINLHIKQTKNTVIRIIWISWHSASDVRERCIAAWMEKFVEKPIHINELIEKLGIENNT